MTIPPSQPSALPPPLGVVPQRIESSGRQIALHVAGPRQSGSPPLLLVHSVNASPSVIEMQALFQRQAQRRAVVALDLPGFGASDRAPGRYTTALMVNAVQDALRWTRQHVGAEPADVVALSLGCEFATLAALADVGALRSLALISPTGMERRRIGEPFENGRSRESRLAGALLHLPGVGRTLYAALTSRPVMRWFLARSWGTRHFDQALLTYGHANAQVAGAHHAPLDFLSGALFTRGIVNLYQRLALPVLVTNGQHGSFTDFEACGHVCAHSPGRWQRRVFATGSMPHLEWAAAFDAAYESWLASEVLPGAQLRPADWPARGAAAPASARPAAEAEDGERRRASRHAGAGLPRPG
jgi:pimeloyl-ACP methyl ester carboxylesterase